MVTSAQIMLIVSTEILPNSPAVGLCYTELVPSGGEIEHILPLFLALSALDGECRLCSRCLRKVGHPTQVASQYFQSGWPVSRSVGLCMRLSARDIPLRTGQSLPGDPSCESGP